MRFGPTWTFLLGQLTQPSGNRQNLAVDPQKRKAEDWVSDRRLRKLTGRRWPTFGHQTSLVIDRPFISQENGTKRRARRPRDLRNDSLTWDWTAQSHCRAILFHYATIIHFRSTVQLFADRRESFIKK